MAIKEYEVCLSIQRGLLDVVTNNLRRVSFLLEENLITIYFFYDGEASEIERELVLDTAAEVISDFPQSYKVDCQIIKTPYPEKITSQGRIVFSRFE
jgi:hypothetical protein